MVFLFWCVYYLLVTKKWNGLIRDRDRFDVNFEYRNNSLYAQTNDVVEETENTFQEIL